MYIYTGSDAGGEFRCARCEDGTFYSIAHVHREIELVYVLENSIKAVIDGEESTAQAGECLLILPHQIHRYDAENHASAIAVNFSGEMVPSFMAMIGNHTADRNVFQPDEVSRLLLKKLLRDGAPKEICDRMCLLYAVCGSFLKAVKLTQRQMPERSPAYHVIQYIAEHYREDISLKKIAKELGYDYHYLSRVFSKTTNVGFREFLNDHRIERARSLLRSTSAPVAEIALECGFQNVRSFNRSFQETMGTTPAAFRATAPTVTPPEATGRFLRTSGS